MFILLYIPGFQSQDRSMLSKYRMGYLECINEVGRFLGSLEIEDVDLRTKIIEHLANCVAGAKLDQEDTEISSAAGNLHTPSVIRPRPEKPVPSLIQTADICLPVSDPHTVINLSLPHTTKAIPLEGFKSAISSENTNVINLHTATSLRQSSLPLSVVQSGHLITSPSNQAFSEPQSVVDNKDRITVSNVNKPYSCDIQPKQMFINQSDMNIKLIGTPSASTNSTLNSNQIFGGLQLLPTILQSGEIAFIVPANIVPTTQSSGYIIPVLSPNTIISSQALNTSAQPANPISVSNQVPALGVKPLSLSSMTSIASPGDNSSLQLSDSNSVIPTYADISPAIQYICDSKQSDLAKLKPGELYTPNQNVFMSSQTAGTVPQYSVPTKYFSIDPTVPSPRTNDGSVGNRSSPYSETISQSGVPGLVLNQTKESHENVISKNAFSNVDKSIRVERTQEHLVLNLAMQNRTRAGQEGGRSNFEAEDENVWRPW